MPAGLAGRELGVPQGLDPLPRRLVGYDYVISIEHEDALMSTDEGLAKGVAMLKQVNIFEQPGEMFWA